MWLQVAELKLMKTLLVEPHPNVVRLLGCCTAASDKEPTYLIMEYVAKGKLQEFLRRYASLSQDHDDYDVIPIIFPQVPSRALLRQSSRIQPEAHLQGSYILLLPGEEKTL